MDDGQVFVRPAALDAFLRSLDASLAPFGGTRGNVRAGNAKSSCRLLCPDAERPRHAGWDTDYVRATCTVLEPHSPTLALGAPFGSDAALDDEVKAVVDKARATRLALLHVDHAPTELVLTRLCADVSELSYQLRLNGDRVGRARLAAFDRDLRTAVETTLGGELPDSAWQQCTTGVTWGGLGLRTAEQTACASFLASRMCSRPHVREMAGHLEQAGLSSADLVMAA